MINIILDETLEKRGITSHEPAKRIGVRYQLHHCSHICHADRQIRKCTVVSALICKAPKVLFTQFSR